jgi:hypothetical protein
MFEKLWLDDIRRSPGEGWHWSRTIEEVKLVIRSHNITIASLDHDMGLHEFDPDVPNADVMRVPGRYACYDCKMINSEVYDMRQGFFAKPSWCEQCGSPNLGSMIGDPDGAEFAEWLVREDLVPEIIFVHSMNQIGAKRIYDILMVNCFSVHIQPFGPACRNS